MFTPNWYTNTKFFYLDRITIVPWRHLVNNIVLYRSPKSPKKSINPLFWRSKFFKVIEFGANQEPMYDFLLVINYNLGPILHRYWDIAIYWLKIAKFAHPLSFSALDRGDPIRIYGTALRFLKLYFQAADGENLVILSCTIFDWSTRFDGQTDGQTELRWLRGAESSSCFRAWKWRNSRVIV